MKIFILFVLSFMLWPVYAQVETVADPPIYVIRVDQSVTPAVYHVEPVSMPESFQTTDYTEAVRKSIELSGKNNQQEAQILVVVEGAVDGAYQQCVRVSDTSFRPIASGDTCNLSAMARRVRR